MISADQTPEFALSIAKAEFERVQNGDAFVSFAQNLEDLQITKILGNSAPSYIDVGCSLPVSNSVTYSSYSNGGNGICIDIREEAIARHRIARPLDTQVLGGLTGTEKKVSSFFLGSRASHSTLDTSIGKALEAKGLAERFDAHHLQQFTLSELAQSLATGTIDLLVMDIEGLEFEVLANHEFESLAPRLIVFESIVPPLASEPDARRSRELLYQAAKENLKSNNYTLVYKDGLNEFWSIGEQGGAEIHPPTFYDNYIMSKHLISSILALASVWRCPPDKLIEDLPDEIAVAVKLQLAGF